MRKVKKVLSLVLLGALALSTPRGIAQAALANDGDSQSESINVSMEVTAQDLGGVTVSIPSEIALAYDSENKVFSGKGYVSAKGYVPHYGRINIAYEKGENKIIELASESGEKAKGNLIYGDMWGKELWHEDELLAGQLDEDDLVKVPIEIKVPNKELRVDTYKKVLTFDVTLERPYLENTDTGVRVGDVVYPYDDASYFSKNERLDQTGETFSFIMLRTNMTNINTLDQAVVTVPRFSDMGITLDQIEGCKYNGDHGAFLPYNNNDPAYDFNTNVETLVLNEDIRRVSGGTDTVEKMYVPKNTNIWMDKTLMPNTDVYYCGTALDYTKHVYHKYFNIINTETFKQYVTEHDALPTCGWYQWQQPELGYQNEYTPNVYVLDENQNFVLLTKEMILALS